MRISFFLFLFSLSVFGQSSYFEFDQKMHSIKYVVKKGDTLSQILNDHGYTGVYKNKEKNRHLNPINLVKWQNGLKEGDLLKLEPGQVLYLPVTKKLDRAIASVKEAQPELFDDEGKMEDISPEELRKIVKEYANQEAGNSWF